MRIKPTTCYFCGEPVTRVHASIAAEGVEWWMDEEGYSECQEDGRKHDPDEPDGAPAEQWEVTTPAEVYRKPDDEEWTP